MTVPTVIYNLINQSINQPIGLQSSLVPTELGHNDHYNEHEGYEANAAKVSSAILKSAKRLDIVTRTRKRKSETLRAFATRTQEFETTQQADQR